MRLSFDDDDEEIRVRLFGDLSWNDRLRLGSVERALRSSVASTLVLDGREASETDRGSFLGLAATARRLAALRGFSAIVLPPAATPAAGGAS